MSSIMRKQVDIVNNKVDLAEEVVERVHKVMHLFRSLQFRALKVSAHDLTHMEAKTLGFFAARPGATQSELVQHSGRDKGQVARLIAGLRERGLLEASAAVGDKRSVHLEVSASGRALQQLLRKQAQRVSAQAVSGLDEAECRQLLTLLAKLQENLSRDDAGNAPEMSTR
jgi:DNA-binding MarR family transcriptional regulator